MQEYIVFLLRVQCRRKESSRSLSHLLMSFLYLVDYKLQQAQYNGRRQSVECSASATMVQKHT